MKLADAKALIAGQDRRITFAVSFERKVGAINSTGSRLESDTCPDKSEPWFNTEHEARTLLQQLEIALDGKCINFRIVDSEYNTVT